MTGPPDSRRATPQTAADVLTTGAARWLRGTTVALAATGLGLVGHVAGGGSVLPTRPLLVLFAALVAGSVALSGRRWTLNPLLAVLLGTQVVFHVAFAGATHHLAGLDHQMMGAHNPSWRMTGAHVAAAVLTALLLRRGETWCWQLAALVTRPVRAARLLTSPSLVASSCWRPACANRVTALRSLLLVYAAPRRGPPVCPAH